MEMARQGTTSFTSSKLSRENIRYPRNLCFLERGTSSYLFIQWTKIGEYKHGELLMNMNDIQFSNKQKKPPESVCSLPCERGQAKKYVEGESCCWHCKCFINIKMSSKILKIIKFSSVQASTAPPTKSEILTTRPNVKCVRWAFCPMQ